MRRFALAFAVIVLGSELRAGSAARGDGLNTYVLNMKFRQLMLDDRVLFKSHGIKKIFPQAQDLGRPVLEATFPYEKFYKVISEPNVRYHADRKLFQMWYWGLYFDKDKKRDFTPLCYAESPDGLTWTKPILGNVEYLGDKRQNNIVTNDLWTPTILALPPGQEFSVLFFDGHSTHAVAFSQDGRKVDATSPLRYGEVPNAREMQDAIGRWISDGYRLMHDPLDGKYHLAIKSWAPLSGSDLPSQWRRTVALGRSDDAMTWKFQERMVECDLADDAFIAAYSSPTRKMADLPAWAEIEQMSLFRYEGLVLGFANLIHFYDKFLGGNESSSHLWWTYDWKNWSKPRDRRPFFNYAHDTPYWGFSKGLGPMPPLRQGNQLWIYRDVAAGQGNERYPSTQQWFTLAKLRLDGWAGYVAGPEQGWLETQEFIADGEELRINADCSATGGALRVEVYEVEGERYLPAHLFKNTLIEGFTEEDCAAISTDAYAAPVHWKSRSWSELHGKRVRLRIFLTNGTIYSFWTKAGDDVLGVQEVAR